MYKRYKIFFLKFEIKQNRYDIQGSHDSEYPYIPLEPVSKLTVKQYESEKEAQHKIHADVEKCISYFGNLFIPGYGYGSVCDKRNKTAHEKTKDKILIRIILTSYGIYTYQVQYH